jgi:hypothetical protein
LAASMFANASTPEAPGSSPKRANTPASHECTADSHEKECSPAAQESDPQESAPASEESAPATKESTPASQTVAPASDDKAPASSVFVPSSSVFTPASSVFTPASQVAAPASQATSPAPHGATSASPAIATGPHGTAPTPASVDDRHNQPNTVLTATGLATADTVLSYCAQVDHSSSAQYLAGITMITQGHDSAETAAIRSTDEYSKTQASLNTQLVKVPYGSALLACRDFVTGSTHHISGFSSPIRTPLGSAK